MNPLIELGMTDAFNGQLADFSNIDGAAASQGAPDSTVRQFNEKGSGFDCLDSAAFVYLDSYPVYILLIRC